MKHLITGGAGFIGSHLVKKLLDMQEKVICLDDLCTGNIRNIENFIAMMRNMNLNYMKTTISG